MSFPKQDARSQSRSVGRVPGPDCVSVGVGQGVDASSWSLMELLSNQEINVSDRAVLALYEIRLIGQTDLHQLLSRLVPAQPP